jgi:spermidine synthase
VPTDTIPLEQYGLSLTYRALGAVRQGTREALQRKIRSMFAPALTILLSSFLLFLVQPILAKQILPWFGGSAGVWTICLMFFQLMLLLGYAYAHWIRRLRESGQVSFHILLLVVSCLTLPIIPATFWQPGHDTVPTLRILGLLAATVGLPYFVLASTTPLLQRWLSGDANFRTHERSIYRLFGLSNFGSLVGLLSYPFVIEPSAPLRVQAWVWSGGYALFVVCFVAYAWTRKRSGMRQDAIASPGLPPSPMHYVYWIGCAALGSTLLLSVTNQITQNVASIPFLWIAPLSLYLLSFVICFEGRGGRGWYERRIWIAPAMLATGAMAWALFADQSVPSIFIALPIFALGIFLGCVVCHGELALSKPNPQYLTHFYLSVAAGGALGGLLVGLMAPQVFNHYWEMPLALCLLGAFGIHWCSKETRAYPKRSWMAISIAASIATLLILLFLGGLPPALDSFALPWAKIVQGDARWGCAALLVLSAWLFQKYGYLRAVGVTALLCTVVFFGDYVHNVSAGTEFAVRNFYGTLTVIESRRGAEHIRQLKHGVIVHGWQIMELPRRRAPTTYYGETSGIGRAILSDRRVLGSIRIGSIGLGAGTLAAYGRPGDLFHVYELNPAVLEIARDQFTYLKDSEARIETVLGDARLSMEGEMSRGAFDTPDQRFDVLSIDAFSGDAIPMHLITREAFAIYMRAVRPDGVIAFHVSNQYLELSQVVEQIAHDAGFRAVLVADRPTSTELTTPSNWVLVARNTAFLERPEIADFSTRIDFRAGLPVWTDQFSNLFQVLRWPTL